MILLSIYNYRMASIISIASEISAISRNTNTTLYTFFFFIEIDNKNHSYNMCITSSFATEFNFNL